MRKRVNNTRCDDGILGEPLDVTETGRARGREGRRKQSHRKEARHEEADALRERAMFLRELREEGES